MQQQQQTVRQQLAAIRRLLAERQYGQAAATAERLRAEQPQAAKVWLYSGVAALESGRPRQATEFLSRAVQLDTAGAAAYAQLARALLLNGETTAALAAARQCLELEPADALSLDTLGVVFSHAGCHSEAAQTFRRAVKTHPDNPGFQQNLGNALRFCGDLQGAREAFEQALRLQPTLARAHFALAHLQRWSQADNHIARLEHALAGCSGAPGEQLYLAHALAKELDDVGDFDRAFAVLTTANTKWREQRPYNPATDASTVAALMADQNSTVATSAITATDSPAPLFVVGMPRTGTTLIERILSSHSAVISAGELPCVPQLAHKLSGSPTSTLLDTETAKQLVAIDGPDFHRSYLEQSRRLAPNTADAKFLIDKLPLNFLYTGLLLRSIPDVRIICLRRHPLDTCLSNFRQLFALDNNFYAYAHDLLDCGRYYLLFDRLMRHWQSLFPGRILEIQYESIVTDQAGQTRALLDFCHLPWEDHCLTFERNTAPVATASSAQVREPLYSRSLAHWKNYEPHLKPLQKLLRDGGIDID